MAPASDVSSLTMLRNTTQSQGLVGRRTLEAYETDEDVGVIVLEGAGTKAFVSGADISQFDDEHANVDAVKAYGTSVARGYGAVQHAKKTIAEFAVTVTAVERIAICTDIRICSDNSSFAFRGEAGRRIWTR